MKRRSLKTVYGILVFLLLLTGLIIPVHAAITNPSSCPATLPQGTAGIYSTYTFTGTGGNNTWRITSGSLPPGLSLANNQNDSVNLQGTPTAAGTYTFTIQHRQTVNPDPTCTCTIIIMPVITTPAVCPATLSSGTVNTAYSYTFTGTGGTGNRWSVSSGTLPPNLTLNTTTGALTGTPNTAGSYNFTITYTGSGTGSTASRSVSCACSLGIVAQGCNFVGGSSGVIDFGDLDPSTTPGPVLGTVTTQVQFTCDSGRAFTVTANPSSGRNLTGPDMMYYTPGFIASGNGQGSTPINLFTDTSQILQTYYQDAPSGNYSNSAQVVFTINCPSCNNPRTIYAYLNNSAGVFARVSDTCGSASSGSMSFAIDPSGSGTLTPATTDSGNTSPSVKCTKNQTHAIACTSGHGYQLTIGNDGTTDPIAYTIPVCATSVTGNGFSTVTSIPVGISIPQTEYQDARAGDHTDTITITVTY
jgi:hypothetical protein